MHRKNICFSLLLRFSVTLIIVLIFPVSSSAAEPTYCTTANIISMEAEAFSENIGYNLINNSNASGGQVMQAGESGSLSFDINFDQSGRWYLWLRTLAPDHTSNGMFLDLDGQRLSAPSDHQYAGETDIYLYKSTSIWFWTPEWQAPGEGFHAGPIAIDTTAGLHRLSIVKRSIENPLIDKIVLTRTNEAPTNLGPEVTSCSTPTISPSPSPTVSPSPSPSPTASPTPNPQESACQKADLNQDGLVDISDYIVMANVFLQSVTSTNRADINQDLIVDIQDYALLAEQFLSSCN